MRRSTAGRFWAGARPAWAWSALNSLLRPRLFAAETTTSQGRGQSAASSGQGQARHLSLPGRRAFAPGDVRLQAQAGGDERASPCPNRFTKGQQIAQLQGKTLTCFGPQYGFKKFGKSGQEICELFPHIGSVADDICIVRSMWTEQINHDPAHTFMNTGSIIAGPAEHGVVGACTDWARRPTDLPGFVVLLPPGRGGQMQPIAARQWSAGILPSKFQGVKFNSVGRPGAVHRRIRRGIEPRAAARFHRGHQRAEPARRRGRCTTRRFRRASRSTRWRSRCNPACPGWWT